MKFKESFMAEASGMDKFINVFYNVLDACPDRHKNKLAQAYEDYVGKFDKQIRKGSPLQNELMSAIEEVTDARVEREGSLY